MTDFHLSRKRMVERQVIARGITDAAVVRAMLHVPRHYFVEEALQDRAYGDFPLPIGYGQTISQPYIVALMTDSLVLTGIEKVLEIGTGSGYQTAVLAELADRVITVERIPELSRRARKILDETGCHRVLVRVADGTTGWKQEAPYDAILVTAGSPSIPDELLSQLREGGRLVIPVGSRIQQNLKRVTRHGSGYTEEDLGACIFVPLVGKKGWRQGDGESTRG